MKRNCPTLALPNVIFNTVSLAMLLLLVNPPIMLIMLTKLMIISIHANANHVFYILRGFCIRSVTACRGGMYSRINT